MSRVPRFLSATLLVLVCAVGPAVACGSTSRLAITETTGPNPHLVAPDTSLIPTVHVVKAVGWRNGETPTPASGLAVTAVATGLNHPRWLTVLPNGDILVAETNAPYRPDDGKGLKGWFFKHFQRKAGGAVPSANRITLLRDADGDNVAETHSVFLEHLNSPFGIALVGDLLYVADTDALLSVPYHDGDIAITAPPRKVADLPAGTLNHHWTKNVIASRDGSVLYVSVGSNSNVAENGIDQERERAAILEIDPRTGARRIFASGLRNPVGMAWEPETGALWVAVNERDELGNDLVPDYITAVHEGAFYGWPYSYYGAHVDSRVKPPRPELAAAAVAPDYALGAHTASLGLAWSPGSPQAPSSGTGMFIGQHGSWNRKPRSGYRVIFVPFSAGRPSGRPIEILTGFVTESGEARGRPVGVAVDMRGNLLVADDVGNTVWRISRQNARAGQ